MLLRMQRLINLGREIEDDHDLLGVLINEQRGSRIGLSIGSPTPCSCRSTASSRPSYRPCACPRTSCTSLAHPTSLRAAAFCRRRCARPYRACLRDAPSDS